MRDIAVLVFSDTQRQLQDRSFNYRAWAGLSIIKDVLGREGYEVGAVDARDAGGKIVLASITSQDAWYDLIAAWVRAKPQDALLVVGGAGVLNVRPIIPLEKNAVFVLGRGEDLIVPLIEALNKGEQYEHPSVIYASDFDVEKRYQVSLGKALYSHPVTLFKGQTWKEAAVGCKYQCLFCNYTWCRDVLQEDGAYGQQMDKRKAVIAGASNMGEHNLREIVKSVRDGSDSMRKGQINSAIDGQSQRIRSAVKKPVSREDLRVFGEFAPRGHVFSLMTIVGFPTETEEDRKEAVDDLWEGLQRRDRSERWGVEISPNAFRPMPGTPLALWSSRVTNWRRDLLREWGGGKGGHKYRLRTTRDGRVGIKMHWGIGGPVTLLVDLIIHRGVEDDFDRLAMLACSGSFWRSSSAKREATLSKYFDLDRAAGEHTAETYPARYLEGRISNERAWEMGARALARLRGGAV